jgi:trk system potassium uptake protein TrkA
LTALEEATGARVAYVMRFGLGTLTTASMALQDGDQVFMLVTDDIAETVAEIAGTAPEGSQ